MLNIPILNLLSTTLALAAAPPPITPPSLTLINPSPSVGHLPPSPYYSTDPSTHITLKFYSYGLPLPPHPVLTVLSTALRDVNAQLYPEKLIADLFLHYSSGEGYLVIQTKGKMTWEVLETTIWGLMHFVETFECVGFDFDVGEFGMERAFGTGILGRFV